MGRVAAAERSGRRRLLHHAAPAMRAADGAPPPSSADWSLGRATLASAALSERVVHGVPCVVRDVVPLTDGVGTGVRCHPLPCLDKATVPRLHRFAAAPVVASQEPSALVEILDEQQDNGRRDGLASPICDFSPLAVAHSQTVRLPAHPPRSGWPRFQQAPETAARAKQEAMTPARTAPRPAKSIARSSMAAPAFGSGRSAGWLRRPRLAAFGAAVAGRLRTVSGAPAITLLWAS